MNRIKLGWGRRETSINEPVSLSGQMYLRISEGIHDPLYVTALAIDGGEGQDHVIFLSCDLGSLPWGLVPDVRAAVAALQPQICGEWIVMNATHTHAATAPRMEQTVSADGAYIYPNDKYRAFFVRMCAEAVVEAWDTRAEGSFAYGYGYAVVGHSRRVCYFHDKGTGPTSANGHCIMYGNTNDPDFSHYEGGADHFLNALYTFDRNDKLTGVIVNVPCPSQVTEHLRMLSADFWGDVRELMAEKLGPDVYILPQCAPAGDLAPRILHYWYAQARRMQLKYGMGYDVERAKQKLTADDMNKRFAERKDIAERIMAAVEEIYGWAKKELITHAPVKHHYWLQPMKRRTITEEEMKACEQKLEELKSRIPEPGDDPLRYREAMSRYQSGKNRIEGILHKYKQQFETPMIPFETHALAIGDVAFATNKFELYQDHMHRVQARSPFTQTFVMQLTGDGAAVYLPTKRSQENKGYGSNIFSSVVGYEGGQQWVEGVLEHLNEIKKDMVK